MTAIELACRQPLQYNISPMRLLLIRSRQTRNDVMPDWDGSDRFSKAFRDFINGNEH
jgi:hypothetical protein